MFLFTMKAKFVKNLSFFQIQEIVSYIWKKKHLVIKNTGTISAEDITIKGSVESGSGAIKLNCEANSHGVSIKGPPKLS